MNLTDKDLEIFAKTIWGESRGEVLEAKRAVACVILNRFNSGKWFGGDSISAVCLMPYQFSCWNKNDPNRIKLDAVTFKDSSYRDCLAVAAGALTGLFKDASQYGTHYHVRGILPDWAKEKTPCAVAGRHLFYNSIP